MTIDEHAALSMELAVARFLLPPVTLGILRAPDVNIEVVALEVCPTTRPPTSTLNSREVRSRVIEERHQIRPGRAARPSQPYLPPRAQTQSLPILPHNALCFPIKLVIYIVFLQYLLGAVDEVLPNAIVVVTVEGMMVRRNSLKVEPRFRQIETAV